MDCKSRIIPVSYYHNVCPLRIINVYRYWSTSSVTKLVNIDVEEIIVTGYSYPLHGSQRARGSRGLTLGQSRRKGTHPGRSWRSRWKWQRIVWIYVYFGTGLLCTMMGIYASGWGGIGTVSCCWWILIWQLWRAGIRRTREISVYLTSGYGNIHILLTGHRCIFCMSYVIELARDWWYNSWTDYNWISFNIYRHVHYCSQKHKNVIIPYSRTIKIYLIPIWYDSRCTCIVVLHRLIHASMIPPSLPLWTPPPPGKAPTLTYHQRVSSLHQQVVPVRYFHWVETSWNRITVLGGQIRGKGWHLQSCNVSMEWYGGVQTPGGLKRPSCWGYKMSSSATCCGG